MFGLGHVTVQHLEPPGLESPRPGHQRKQAGFAHSVRADEAEGTVGRQLEGNILQRPGIAVTQTDPLQPHHG